MAIWDLAGDRRLDRRFAAGRPSTFGDTPKGLALSPDDRTLAVTQVDGTLDLIDSRSLARRRHVPVQKGALLAADFSPDGRTLAVSGEGARVRLLDARTLEPTRTLEGLQGLDFSQAVTFSPDGRLIAAGGITERGGRVRVWDVRTGAPARVRSEVASPSLAFSPDGRLLAAAGIEDYTEVRDVRTGRVVAAPRTGDFVRSVAFSPDGRLLAIGHYGGSARLVSTSSWKPVGRRLDGHRARITALEFAPDGKVLMTGAADGTVLLWDLAKQRPIGSPLTVERDAFMAATFARDGRHLFAVPEIGRGVRWDIRPESWKRHACLVAGRDLSPREWREVLPGRSYRSVCPQG
jgi:WD40 repeat protein